MSSDLSHVRLILLLALDYCCDARRGYLNWLFFRVAPPFGDMVSFSYLPCWLSCVSSKHLYSYATQASMVTALLLPSYHGPQHQRLLRIWSCE